MTHQSRILVPLAKYLGKRYGLICGCEHVMYVTGVDGKKSARVHILIGNADHVLANIDLPDEPEVERDDC